MKIVGHQKQIEKLEHILQNHQIGHAYIFEGIEGIGKFTIAKAFAKALCQEAEALQEGDTRGIQILVPENHVIKVDEIRSLKDELMLKPTVTKRKVAIINDAECMNEQAQNALLKILEEPPEYVTIILITTNQEKLLYTIKSRCTVFHFQPLTPEEVKEYFGDNLEEEIMEYSRGSIGTILRIQENQEIELIKRWVSAFQQKSLLTMMKECNDLREEKYAKEHLEEILRYLLYFYHQQMKKERINTIEAIEIVENTRNNILKNANVDIALDRMVIKLWKWRRTCKKL